MTDRDSAEFWLEMAQAGPESVQVGRTTIRRGSRVLLHPNRRGDILDLVLADRMAMVEGIDVDDAGAFHIAVVIEDDPGRDLGAAHMPGHRFYFAIDEVEPMPRILVAGIGNVFLGDDGFGVEVARLLIEAGGLPAGVDVADFGIRGMDLAYALQDYDIAILLDAVRRGGAPGTLYVIDASTEMEGTLPIDTHGMDPLKALALARRLGHAPGQVLVIGCEPAFVPDPDTADVVNELSAPVRAAVEPAIRQARTLLNQVGATRHEVPHERELANG